MSVLGGEVARDVVLVSLVVVLVVPDVVVEAVEEVLVVGGAGAGSAM